MPTLPQKTAGHKPADLDWAAALQADMRTVVRQAIEHLVGAELAAVLGPPYARGEARVGYRHGSKGRTITSPVGAMTLTVPRARVQWTCPSFVDTWVQIPMRPGLVPARTTAG